MGPVMTISKREAVFALSSLQEYRRTRDATLLVERWKESYARVHGKSPFYDCDACWDFVYFVDICCQIEQRQLYEKGDVVSMLQFVFVPPTYTVYRGTS